MAGERAVEDLVSAVARLKAEIHDFRCTAMARVQRGMTGDIEPTVRSTPKAGALLMQGQSVLRADYPVLWQWVQDHGLNPGVFGNGNGSTTFTLPDLRGRFTVGDGTLGSDTYDLGDTGGAARVQQTIAQMARHSHTGVMASDGAHGHTSAADTGAASGAHVHTGSSSSAVADHSHAFAASTSSDTGHYHAQGDTGSSGGGGYYNPNSTTHHSHKYQGRWGTSSNHHHSNRDPNLIYVWANSPASTSGSSTYTTDPTPNGSHPHDVFDTPTAAAHTHTLPGTANGGGHSHTFSAGASSGGGHSHTMPDTGITPDHDHGIPLDGGTSGGAGPGAAMDTRPPYLAMNWLIWT